MKKLLIYPYNEEQSLLVKYKHDLKDYTLVSAVYAKGAKKTEHKTNTELDIRFSDYFENELEKCDAVFMGRGFEEQAKEVYVEKIRLAHDNKKEILIERNVFENIKHLLKGFKVTVIGDGVSGKPSDNRLMPIDIPIISISSLGEECGKLDTTMMLVNELRRKGYKVIAFGSNNLSEMMGIRLLPAELFDDSYSIVKKIVHFNHMIYELIRREKPEVIVISMPGGLMPISKYINNYFGELPYVISKAVTIDINILCMYFYAQLNRDFLYGLQEYTKVFLGCETEYFNISNTEYNINKENVTDMFQTFHISKEDVESKLNCNLDPKITIFNTDYGIGTDDLIDSIVAQLTNNADVI